MEKNPPPASGKNPTSRLDSWIVDSEGIRIVGLVEFPEVTCERYQLFPS